MNFSTVILCRQEIGVCPVLNTYGRLAALCVPLKRTLGRSRLEQFRHSIKGRLSNCGQTSAPLERYSSWQLQPVWRDLTKF